MDGKTRWLFIYANSSHKTAKKRISRPINTLMELSTQREATRMTLLSSLAIVLLWHLHFSSNFLFVNSGDPTNHLLSLFPNLKSFFIVSWHNPYIIEEVFSIWSIGLTSYSQLKIDFLLKLNMGLFILS
jgi:hypothetical protein